MMLTRKGKSGLDFELTEEQKGADSRRWHVSLKGGGRCHPQFIVELTGRQLQEVPAGSKPIDRDWTEEEILNGVVLAVEDWRVSPPEKRPGKTYPVILTSFELYEANGLL
jgi:hypothetical protein